ncbi:MAG: hypothetical protein R3B95_07710 [Nitrospirales bacterium]|nr:hypothetical protein [Nitrospirales bacterium]
MTVICGTVPFNTRDDHTYLYQLNEALRGGGLGSQDPLRRYALEHYTDLVSEWLEEDLRTIDGERVAALNKDHDYPYWFAYVQHECEGVKKRHLMVDQETWYHFYLDAMEDMDTLPPEEGKVPSLNFSQDMA